MVIFQYRWKIPPEEQESFCRDWRELTEVARKTFGATDVILCRSEDGTFVAIATWPTAEAWQMWKEGLANHPLRQKYRQYRVSGPELLLPVVTFTPDAK